ncbi:Expansin 1 [Micractinium conductrix]|uniref:Expansin 1 n=1 Tax=Micractinium conductrix TaxID=554055 RepID=A0A2P6V132_9CHLO|nr:Expansin 1 [Micractinium conductrix]|eukprot:PSC67798.1 Expansin 1 [Micractinium conductrix]
MPALRLTWAAAAAALLLAMLAGCAAAARPLSPAAEQPLASGAEPNVTAQSGPMPLSGGGAPWLPAGTFSGEGTAFSEAVPGTGAGFACSFRYLNPFFSTNFAAINRPMWDEGHACGKCVTAWCVDDLCPVKGKRVQVQITDLCPECKEGDVDFSIPVYREITGMWPHRLAIQWEWSDCSPQIEGDIIVTPKDGINAQWQAFYFANFRYPLNKVLLNGKELQREQFQFWIHSGELQTPATFELEAVNGQRVVATVDNATQGETKIPNFPTAY